MELSKFEANIEGKINGGRAQHVNAIPSIDPSSDFPNCSRDDRMFVVKVSCPWVSEDELVIGIN